MTVDAWAREKWEECGRRGQRESMIKTGSRGGTSLDTGVVVEGNADDHSGDDIARSDIPFASDAGFKPFFSVATPPSSR